MRKPFPPRATTPADKSNHPAVTALLVMVMALLGVLLLIAIVPPLVLFADGLRPQHRPGALNK